jgi:hypothetical protein
MKRISVLVRGGVACGLAAGLAAGAMAGAPLFGMSLGGAAGLVAGLAMERDENRRSARHQQLDAIIGVHGGDLGAPPGSIPPGPLGQAEKELGSWAAEWLTPPPPRAT